MYIHMIRYINAQVKKSEIDSYLFIYYTQLDYYKMTFTLIKMEMTINSFKE